MALFPAQLCSEWQHHNGLNGSKLRIRKVTSKDAGLYRCVGKNWRDQYVVTEGYVRILWGKIYT